MVGDFLRLKIVTLDERQKEKKEKKWKITPVTELSNY